jgi:hypothetical protein
MKAIMKKIDKLYDQASDLAVEAVMNEAREILKADPNLHEFIMAMGRCFFTVKDGGKYDINSYTDEEYDEWSDSDDFVYSYNGIIDDDHGFQKEFFDNVFELNDRFQVMGYPVRFTATSKPVHSWGDTRKNPVKYIDK